MSNKPTTFLYFVPQVAFLLRAKLSSNHQYLNMKSYDLNLHLPLLGMRRQCGISLKGHIFHQ